MRLLIRGCTEPGGETKPLYSLWGSLAALFAAAATGGAELGEIDVWNPCIREAIHVLQLLGYRIEQVSSTRLVVWKEEKGVKPLIARMELACGLLLAELAAPFFALHAPPGSRLVIKAHGYEYLLGIDTRPLRELVAQLGARIWGGGSVSRYLVIEKITSVIPRIIRVHTGYWGLVASAIPALSGIEAPPPIRIGHMSPWGRRRVALVSSILSELGYELTIAGNMVRIRRASTSRGKVIPPRGVSETLLVLLYTRLCGGSQIVLRSRDLKGSDMEELIYLLKILGYHVGKRDDTLALVKSEPRRLVHSVGEYPELSIPLATHAGLIGDSIISDIGIAITEGLVSNSLEVLVTNLGGEAYIEEGARLRIIKPINKLPGQTYSCQRFDPASCSLLVGAALSKNKVIILNEAEKAIWFSPFLLQQLQELGVDIVAQK